MHTLPVWCGCTLPVWAHETTRGRAGCHAMSHSDSFGPCHRGVFLISEVPLYGRSGVVASGGCFL